MKNKFISKRYWNNITTPMGESGALLRQYDDLINFSLGDPDYNTDERIINAAFEDARRGHTHYTEFSGYSELREEICSYHRTQYGNSYSINECMVTTSGCHAMWLVMEAILDDGDEVIVPEPYFTPYPQQIKLVRGIPVPLNTYEEQNYQIDTERLRALITNRTKAMILNSPNNPTGACLTRETLEKIAAIAVEYDLIVIADDIYTAFSYGSPFIPMATLPGMKERTITICSFSKDYAMTGWRIGYVLAPDYIIQTMQDINENNVFTAPSISQRAALHALRLRDQVQPEMIAEYRKRIFYSYERISAIPNMSVLYPQGSIYLFPNIKKTGLSSAAVADRILKEAHVLVLPGNAFGAEGEGYLRIAVTVGLDKLKEAFDRIEKMGIFQG